MFSWAQVDIQNSKNILKVKQSLKRGSWCLVHHLSFRFTWQVLIFLSIGTQEKWKKNEKWNLWAFNTEQQNIYVPTLRRKRKKKKAHDYRLSVKVIRILKMSCGSQYVGQQKQPRIPHAQHYLVVLSLIMNFTFPVYQYECVQSQHIPREDSMIDRGTSPFFWDNELSGCWAMFQNVHFVLLKKKKKKKCVRSLFSCMKKITGVKGPTIAERRGHEVEADAGGNPPLLVNPREGCDVVNNQINQQFQLLTSY